MKGDNILDSARVEWDANWLNELIENLRIYLLFRENDTPDDNTKLFGYLIGRLSEVKASDSGEFPIDDDKFKDILLFVINVVMSYLRVTYFDTQAQLDGLIGKLDMLRLMNEPPSGLIS